MPNPAPRPAGLLATLRTAAAKALVDLKSPAPSAMALKSASAMRFGTYGGGSFGGFSGTTFPYMGDGTVTLDDADEDCRGNPWMNSAVAACMGWIADNFGQPKLRIKVDMPDGGAEYRDDHPALWFMERPNEDYRVDALWSATNLSYDVNGVAYWIKSRAPSGKKIYCHYVPHWEIRPTWTDGRSYISGYVHTVDGVEYPLKKEDVVRFARGLDPESVRQGLATLGPVFREIEADNYATRYVATILRNMGVSGVVVMPDIADGTIEPEVADKLKRAFSEARMNRTGDPIVTSFRVAIKEISVSPEKMNLHALRKYPEARICAAFKIPPTVVGLSVGEESRSYANQETDVHKAFANCLVPRQEVFARCLTEDLLRDLGGNPRESFVWDYSNVKAMAEDQQVKATRIATYFAANIYSFEEAREAAGLGPAKAGDHFLTPSGATVTVFGQEPAALPAPTAPQAALPAPGPAAGKSDESAVETKGDPVLERAIEVLAEVERRLDEREPEESTIGPEPGEAESRVSPDLGIENPCCTPDSAGHVAGPA